jgi:hypothetical protein
MERLWDILEIFWSYYSNNIINQRDAIIGIILGIVIGFLLGKLGWRTPIDQFV